MFRLYINISIYTNYIYTFQATSKSLSALHLALGLWSPRLPVPNLLLGRGLLVRLASAQRQGSGGEALVQPAVRGQDRPGDIICLSLLLFILVVSLLLLLSIFLLLLLLCIAMSTIIRIVTFVILLLLNRT